MPRALMQDRRYDCLGPESLGEAEYVDVLLQHSGLIFPGYIAVPFGEPHIYEQDEAVQHLALIRMDYLAWWVVVVHLNEALEDDLLPAVAILRRTTYGIIDAEALLAAADLNHDAVVRLTREEQPGVVVVVGRLHLDWRRPLAAEQAILTVAEVFEADDGSRILRVNGEQPAPIGAVVSTCRIDSASPRLVQLADATSLGDIDEFLIDYQGAAARWHRLETDTGTCLYTGGPTHLPPSTDLELVRISDGRLLFRSSAPLGGIDA